MLIAIVSWSHLYLYFIIKANIFNDTCVPAIRGIPSIRVFNQHVNN